MQTIKLHRDKGQEDFKAGGTVCLWFEDGDRTFIASVIRDKVMSPLGCFNTSLRISYPEGHCEIGFVGSDAQMVEQRLEDYKRNIKKCFKEKGYEVEYED